MGEEYPGGEGVRRCMGGRYRVGEEYAGGEVVWRSMGGEGVRNSGCAGV